LGAATVLTLSLTVPASEDVGRSAAGWAAHLEMLQTALLGATARFPIAVFKRRGKPTPTRSGPCAARKPRA
jgi:hypothetical protein